MPSKTSLQWLTWLKGGRIPWRAAVLAAVTILLVAAYIYADRTGAVSMVIRTWGPAGVVLAIVVMGLVCMTPIPSEGLLVLFMKVYGVLWGIVFGWLGSILSSVAIFVMARYLGRPLLERWMKREGVKTVASWIEARGTGGLLTARLLPVPAFIVNYVAGVLESIPFGAYLWTAAVSIIPYYLGTALVFMGISTRFRIWIPIGAVALILIWMLSTWLNGRATRRT